MAFTFIAWISLLCLCVIWSNCPWKSLNMSLNSSIFAVFLLMVHLRLSVSKILSLSSAFTLVRVCFS